MINATDSPINWALLLYELDDAKEHIESLMSQMAEQGQIDEIDFKIQIAHVYAHLNRSWNTRNLADDTAEERSSAFPNDLEPI
ncbi:hypothetical protein [Acaryochloris sp. CCMEE 5410]|uniref:hypothetical protein n=1 Tax=Acaryochloris sp. CCMEE 5410 TaxID=310037 RepID=UPI0002484BEE|nr:hypothetical protein [Acaryochloris sp. CCMEE 5410]KAI9130823.1 hypothetical protein ON05_024080 [Acaryochloris sp. CCMEE 5410]